MKEISVFDTSISDYNLGNQIIMDGVYKHLFEIFPNDFFYKLPVMEITKHTAYYLKRSDLVFFGGTNALTNRMERNRQWGISPFNYSYVKGTILVGLGWRQYQKGKISLYTKFLYKRILNEKYIHSVRDSYTEKKMKENGFDNVINTGCPSMWDLTPEHCKNIKQNKSENVVIALTDYNQNKERDEQVAKIILNNYKKVFFWPQGPGDYQYAKKLFGDKAEIIPPNILSYNDFLSKNDVDYIGTRLHAGIRALQFKRRSMIIAIDNRATEMGKDFNLPTISIDNLGELEKFINSNFETKLTIPFDNINKWKKQFLIKS